MIGAIADLLAPFWGYIAGGLAALAGVLVAYFKGRKDQHDDDAMRDAYDYQDTRNRMDEVDHDDDVDAARDRLRRRGSRGAVRRD